MNVLNLEHISKTYGEKVIFDDISCGIHQGDKINWDQNRRPPY